MPYKCDLCPKSYSQPAYLRNHKAAAHFGLKLFKCNLCDKSYTDPTPLTNHIRTIHAVAGSFKCNECNEKFTHEPKLKAHIYRKHKKLEKPKEKCGYCHKLYDKDKIKGHVQRHLDIENAKWRCSICSKVVCNEKTLKVHVKTQHIKKEKTLKCERCETMFSNKQNLLRHISFIHNKSQAGRWVCQYCGKEFKQSGTLYNHKQMHEGVKFKCPHCDNIYSANANLKKHMNKHKVQNLIKCNICEKEIPDYTLKTHLITHSEKKHHCRYCEYKTYSKRELTVHLTRKKHQGRTIFKTCEVCNKDIASKEYKDHYDGHKEQCSICDFKGKYKKSLNNHMKKVHNVPTSTDAVVNK